MSKTAKIQSTIPGSDRYAYLMRADNNVNVYAPHSVSIDPAALFSALAGLGFPDDGWTECTLREYDAAAVKGTPRRTEYHGYPAKLTAYYIKTPKEPAMDTTTPGGVQPAVYMPPPAPPHPARCRCTLPHYGQEPAAEPERNTNLPRPITANEIRKGDRIRVEWTSDDITQTSTGIANSYKWFDRAGGGDRILAWFSPGHLWLSGRNENETITLLDRPEPPLPTEPGSTIWAREVRGIRYTGDGKGWLLMHREGDYWAGGIRIDGYTVFSPERITDWEPAVVS